MDGSETAKKAFEKAGGHKFSDSNWLQYIYKWSNKNRFQYCKNSRDIIFVHSWHSRTHQWKCDSAWVDGSCRYSIKKEEFPDALMMLFQSSDSSLENEQARKEDRPSSSHYSTHPGTIQMKKNPAMITRCWEKYTTTASGKLLRTPSTGSIYPEHRTKKYDSGTPDPMP